MTLEWSPEFADPEERVSWHLLTDLRVSWWFGDTGRNAQRLSCEEGGEGEDGRAGERKGMKGKGGEKKRERKAEGMQGVGRMGREKERREGME